MYEGKKEGENPKGGARDDACKDLGGHGSLGRAGFDGGVQYHSSGVREGTPAAKVAPGCGEPLHVK